jgi:hypothetical protein
MKKIIGFVVLLAAMTQAATLPLSASFSPDGTCTAWDSLRFNIYWNGTWEKEVTFTTARCTLNTSTTVAHTGSYQVQLFIKHAVAGHTSPQISAAIVNTTSMESDAVNVWNLSFGTAFTAGSMGDSLNGMQYSKLSQLALAKFDSLQFNGSIAHNPSFLRPTVGGRALSIAAGGQAGVDLDNTLGTIDDSEISLGAIDFGDELDTNGMGMDSIHNALDYTNNTHEVLRQATSTLFTVGSNAISSTSLTTGANAVLSDSVLQKNIFTTNSGNAAWVAQSAAQSLRAVRDSMDEASATGGGGSDFIGGHAIKGTVTAGASKTTFRATALNADSNDAYVGRMVVFGGTSPAPDVDIKYAVRTITAFFASVDSVIFTPPLKQAPAVGDSIFVLPIQSWDFMTARELTDTALGTLFNRVDDVPGSLGDTLYKALASGTVNSIPNLGDLTNCGAGQGGTSLSILVLDTSGVDTPIAGAVISLYGVSNCSGNFSYQSISGSNGTAVFSVLQPDTYYACISAPPITFTSGQSIPVLGAKTDTLEGYGVVITSSASPGMGIVYGQLDISGVGAIDCEITITLTKPDTLTISSQFPNFGTNGVVTVYTNSSGVWSTPVYPLAGTSNNFYYTYRDCFGRTFTFRPTTAGTVNVNTVLFRKP